MQVLAEGPESDEIVLVEGQCRFLVFTVSGDRVPHRDVDEGVVQEVVLLGFG